MEINYFIALPYLNSERIWQFLYLFCKILKFGLSEM